jgi:predicted neuraminidase
MARAEGKVPLIQWKDSAVFSLVCSSFFLQAQPLDKCVLVREFIYDKAPFRSAHASTIVETPARTLLAAWFGGTSEGNKDVEIWLSRRSREGNWSTPIQVTDTPDMPVWNPVLFQDSGKTWLFFKVGPSPREWVGGYRISSDDGLTWSPVEYLPAGLTGPIRTKPLRLSDGTWLAGTSVEAGYDGNTPASAPYRSWSVWVERSTDRGITWTTERLGRIMRASSKDRGMTWTPARVTELPNPNAGIDAVRLRNGLLVLVYNHLTKGRGAIHVAVSGDDGETWGSPVVLEDGQTELSYPAVIQAMDGAVHITYTWNRTRIRHLILDADALRRR